MHWILDFPMLTNRYLTFLASLVEWKLTLDGLMTLIAGFLAFGAVQWQMWDQRRTLRQEQDRQKGALQRAVLFEIDGFYRYHLRGLRDYIKRFDLKKEMPLPVVKPIETNPFSIYQGNAGKLGELEPETLEAVVMFYNAAGRHVSTRAAWKTSIERILAGRNNAVEQEAACRLATEIQRTLPLQIGLAWLACKRLSEKAGVKFEDLAVSKEFESMDQILNVLKGEDWDSDVESSQSAHQSSLRSSQRLHQQRYAQAH